MRVLVLVTAAFFATSALAQLRAFPPEARLAQMTHLSENIFDVNGQEEQLSPGAQIRDQLNRIIMPATLPPASLVRVLRDEQGAVHRVWILTPVEVEQLEQDAAQNR